MEDNKPYVRSHYRKAPRKCKACKKCVENNAHFIKCPTVDIDWMADVPETRRFQLGRDVLTCFREVIDRSPPLRNENITSWDLSRVFKATLDEARPDTFDKEWWNNYEHVVSIALRRLLFPPVPQSEKRAVSFLDMDAIGKAVDEDDDERQDKEQQHQRSTKTTGEDPELDDDQCSIAKACSGESRVESVVGGSQTARALKRSIPPTPSEVINNKRAKTDENVQLIQIIAQADDKTLILDILREKWVNDKDMATIGLEGKKEDTRKAEAEARKAEAEKEGILAKERIEQIQLQLKAKPKSTSNPSMSSFTLFDLLRGRRVTMDVAHWAIRNADQLPNTKLRHIATPTKTGLTRGLTTDIVFEGESDEDKISKKLMDMAASAECTNNNTQSIAVRKSHTVKLKTALQNCRYTLRRLDDAAALLRHVEPDDITSIASKNGNGPPRDCITADLAARLTEILPREWRYTSLRDYLLSLGVAATDVQRLANYAFHSKHNPKHEIIIQDQKQPTDYEFVLSDIDKVRRDILFNIAELRALIEGDDQRPPKEDEQRQFIEPSAGNPMRVENGKSAEQQPPQPPVSRASRRPANYFAKRCADIVTLPPGKIMAMTDILKEAGVFKILRKMGVDFTPLPIVRDVARTSRLVGQRGVDHDNYRALYSTDDFAVIMDAVDIVCGQHFPLVFGTD